MSPEQARGVAVDARSDLFSIGVILYEMLAGRLPFDGPTTGDILVALLDRSPQPLARYAPETSSELQGVISRLLAKITYSAVQPITAKPTSPICKAAFSGISARARLETGRSGVSACAHH